MDRIPNDTHPDAARVQLELLRAATPARRLALMHSLTKTAIELSRQALRQQRPELTEFEVKLEWVALTYGADLARRVREYLVQRGLEDV